MVRTEVDGRVWTLTFDRPDARNAFTEATARELVAGLDDAADDDARAVVLTGEGKAFSAGGDLEAMRDREETPAEAYTRVSETLNAVVKAILTAPFPVVAKVNGDAVGAGTNVAAACDFVVADDRARFGEVFVNVGLIPDSGGTVLLPRLVGLRRAKELTMTGRLFDAEEALEMGLINDVVSGEELDGTVSELLETLASKPTETLALIKRGLHENVGRPFRDGLDREANLQVQAYGTDSHAEGVDAFLEGRSPEFE
ncbi:enoyl-CoA hydratase [Haloprofundus marisrubri]|uniref:Enoyl-CoA hydratase n=1 Tax=Haloprofundus marisrubri TaxID=1514971 RepID=A0A0W1R2T4_9EURY|nr:enoyl-CoA hydratase-related protein [Haloprofundus marisrubri]KTG07618.1 enoyl-CoA hydratase [Haloprofundus marisrubri]